MSDQDKSDYDKAREAAEKFAGKDAPKEVIDGGFYRFAYLGPPVKFPAKDFEKGPDGTTDYKPSDPPREQS
jgi:hypothetical protein